MSSLNEQYFKTRETHEKNFKKPWWILWLLVLFIFIGYVLKEINQQVEFPGVATSLLNGEYCIQTEELKLGTISIDCELAGLPKPISKIHDQYSNSTVWKYNDMQIETVNDDHIYYLKALSENVSTPSGLKIGLSKAMTAKILFGQKASHREIGNQLNVFQIVNCETERYLIIEFESDKISKLEIGLDLP